MKLNYWYIRNRRKLSQHDKGHLQKKKSSKAKIIFNTKD